MNSNEEFDEPFDENDNVDNDLSGLTISYRRNLDILDDYELTDYFSLHGGTEY